MSTPQDTNGIIVKPASGNIVGTLDDARFLSENRRERASGFVLKYADVRKLITRVSLARFTVELINEIEAAYRNLDLTSRERVGWPTADLDTLEMMGCYTSDTNTVKVIGSAPSAIGGLAQVVEGTLTSNQIIGGERVQLQSDATGLTPLRTAAGTAMVLRMLKQKVETVGIVGAGLEGTSHAYALASSFPELRRIVLTDIDMKRARRAAIRVKMLLRLSDDTKSRNIDIIYDDASDLTTVYSSDVIVTATYGVRTHGACPVITDKDKLKDGVIIAAVGADLKGKRELADEIYDDARFLADDLPQCFVDGELQHAAKRLRIPNADIESLEGHGGLLLGGRISGVADFLQANRVFMARSEPVIIYDSTGFSGQDHAAAAVVRRFLEELSWPRDLWNPPGDADLYEMVTDPDSAE